MSPRSARGKASDAEMAAHFSDRINRSWPLGRADCERAGLAGRFRLFARDRSRYHPGYPLCRLQQFRRTAAGGLWGGRVRGEARGRAVVEERSGGIVAAGAVAEDAGLLPPDAGG